MNSNQSTESDIETYRRIRSAIGYLGILLPIILLIFSITPFFETDFQHSISHYYYTNLREIFTGILCSVGLFLIRYKGFGNSVIWKNDGMLTNIAGYMAFGIAFIPTNPDHCCQKIYTLIPYCNQLLNTAHYIFAAIFFIITANISINVFVIGQKVDLNISKSIFNENNIYKICGYLILLFIFLIPVLSYFKVPYSTFILEALSLVTFGITWLIKGRALGDKGNLGKTLYCENN